MKSRSEVVRESYNFNCGLIPVKMVKGTTVNNAWFTVDSTAVVLETVKICEPVISDDEETDVKKILVRLFESCGDRTLVKYANNFYFLNEV